MPAGAIGYTTDYRMASSSRDGWSTTGDGWSSRARATSGAVVCSDDRSSCGRWLAGRYTGCEAELVALGNVVFDLGRFGVRLVVSPRHADGIVVPGAVNTSRRLALQKAYEAVLPPKLVIAVGACATSGGPFAGSPEVAGGVDAILPVDLWVPG